VEKEPMVPLAIEFWELNFIDKAVEVKFNRANCPNEKSCKIDSCDSLSKVGYVETVQGIFVDGDGQTYFSLSDGSCRWVCRCVLVEEIHTSIKTILSCPRCNGELVNKEAEEPFTGKKYMIDKCKDCGWC
jgi:hypothetical protein